MLASLSFQVLEWLLCGHYDFRSWSWRQGCTQGSVPLHLLSPEALKQLENALVDALPRSQSGDEVQHLVSESPACRISWI